jgi:hypothetical protein
MRHAWRAAPPTPLRLRNMGTSSVLGPVDSPPWNRQRALLARRHEAGRHRLGSSHGISDDPRRGRRSPASMSRRTSSSFLTRARARTGVEAIGACRRKRLSMHDACIWGVVPARLISFFGRGVDVYSWVNVPARELYRSGEIGLPKKYLSGYFLD